MRRIVLLSLAIAVISGQAQAAITSNGHGVNAITSNAITSNAITMNAITMNAITLNGVSASGAPLFGDAEVVDVALPAN